MRPLAVKFKHLEPELTTKSPPIKASHSPIVTRMADISFGDLANLQWI